MIIKDLRSISQLPEPALGLLPAIHDAVVEEFVDGNTLLDAKNAKGRVFVNKTSSSIIIPPSGRWPARSVAMGDLFGSDGRLFYSVVHKLGTTSYYPKSFERNIYTLSFTPSSFPPGSQEFVLERYFYFRLIGNNTSAVWSVIFELGVREDDITPKAEYSLQATLVQGQNTIAIPTGISQLAPRMLVTGDGIRNDFQDTYISEIDVANGTVLLSRSVVQSGVKTLVFSASPGPNIGTIKWLPPLLEQQIYMTDLKSENGLGVMIKNNRDIGPDTNALGYSGRKYLYDTALVVPMESLPTRTTFLMRVRLGQFDTENNVSDPKGYAAYVVRGKEDREPMN
jgi:hypothetical protein